MTIRQVLKMGDPFLSMVAEPVQDFTSQSLKDLIIDMQDTMDSLNGAGLAAPQIGVSLRVVIFGVKKTPRYPDAEEVPYTILINPKLIHLDDEIEEGWEGCLSVPGLRGLVPRFKKLRYQGYDLNHNFIDRSVSDFHARVVQHECDHLDGILYPMRMKDLSNFGFSEVLFPNSDLQDD